LREQGALATTGIIIIINRIRLRVMQQFHRDVLAASTGITIINRTVEVKREKLTQAQCTLMLLV